MEFALQQLALISRSGEGLLAAEGMRIRFAAPAQTVFFSAKCTVVHLALVEKVISRYAGMEGFVKEYFHIMDLFYSAKTARNLRESEGVPKTSE